MAMKIFSKKNTPNIIMITFGVFLCFSLYYYFGVYNSVSDVIIQANYISYDDINELDKSADLIVVGSSDKDFNDSKHEVTFFDDGTLQDFYSVTQVNIHKILKGVAEIKNGDSLGIIEPASIIQSVEGKQRLLRDDYLPLEKNKKYILFLKKNDSGQYSIINMDLGKLDLSFKTKSLNINQKDEKFMKSAFDKYQTE